jgi:hypothetical protein
MQWDEVRKLQEKSKGDKNMDYSYDKYVFILC